MSSGNQRLRSETSESIAEKIIAGVTTRAELIDMLGPPMETTFTDGGQEIVKYEYTRLTPRARNFIPYNIFSHVNEGHKKELVVLISKQNVVKRVVLNESEIERRSGVAE
jgi:hypothetical protein